MVKTSQYYVFTHFKYPELYKDYFKLIQQLPKFRYIIGQLETCPTSGKAHIQGYMEFTSKQSIKQIQAIMHGVHLEQRQGTQAEARNYCIKKDTRLSEPYELGSLSTNQGSRTDITMIRTLMSENISLKNIILHYCSNYQTIRIAEKLFQYNAKPRQPENPPTILWYYGETGTGKTRHVFDYYHDIYPSFSYKWWDGYEQNEVILIDDMRKDYAKFHVLLKLLDRFPHIVQTKGGTTHINSPTIIITSAYHPAELYDTREDISQLLRRITTIVKFPQDAECLGKYSPQASISITPDLLHL